MNNTKQHIKSYLKEKQKNEKDKNYPFSYVTRVDFDSETEGLRYLIDKLTERLTAQDVLIENANFAIIVMSQLLKDSNIATNEAVQEAARKVQIEKQMEIEKYEESRLNFYKDQLLSNSMKPADA